MSKEVKLQKNFLLRLNERIDSSIRETFYKLGLFIAKYPMYVIIGCLAFILLTCIGFINFKTESRGEKLWLPQNTQGTKDQAKYELYFPQEIRTELLVITPKLSTNLFNNQTLQAAMTLHKEIENISVTVDGEFYSFFDLCLPSYESYPCVVSSILEVWDYSLSKLKNDNNPLRTFNEYGYSEDEIDRLLGDITYDDDGNVVSAEALLFTYLLENNERKIADEYRDPIAEAWEKKFLDLTLQTNKILNIYPWATRSFEDEFGKAITSDVSLFGIAYVIMILYLIINLGRCNPVLSRANLSLLVILSIGLAIAGGMGFSSGVGFFYGPVHSILPFIILGIGVDDTFVIVNSFIYTDPADSVPKRIATALAESGSSITVTSLTDFFAFLIGATSVLPALSSFCFYAAISILLLYGLQITFFVACLLYDSNRQQKGMVDCRCILYPCQSYLIKDPEAIKKEYNTKRSDTGILSKFISEIFAPFLMKPVVKISAIIAFSCLFAVMCYGATKLSVENSERSFIPDNSYLQHTLSYLDKYFGNLGQNFYVVTENFDYFENQDTISNLKEYFTGYENKSPYIKTPTTGTYTSWYDSYIEWLQSNNTYNTNTTVEFGTDGFPSNRYQFFHYLQIFLNETDGSSFYDDIIFDGPFNITASRFEFEYMPLKKWRNGKLQDEATKQISALVDTRKIVDRLDIPAFPWTPIYLEWEVLKVIELQLFLSIGLCFLIVFIITLILIADLQTSLFVFLCVFMIIVEILGIMYFWDLVIDSVAVINLTLAVGLSVDYCAHVGHCFVRKSGTNDQRVIQSVADIGTPVIHGAFSTFLAVVLLAGSKSYVFRVFFKQFFSTIVLGLGHGMIFLPVILSYLGTSKPVDTKTPEKVTEVEIIEK